MRYTLANTRGWWASRPMGTPQGSRRSIEPCRFELNCVKVALAAKNAYVVVYGVRISDPQDYTGEAKIYLDQHSGEVGHALANTVLPDIGTLPHKEF